MINPAEIVFWEVLPAIRKNLVSELKELGLKQAEIAKLLEMTPSAISQYTKNKRGEFEFKEDFKQKIKESAKKIYNKEATVFDETNHLVKEFENSKNICIVCRSKNDIEGDCGICFK